MTKRVVRVVDYDPGWPQTFEFLRGRLSTALSGVAMSIEHVGSTSVPGLPAKAVIDIDIVVSSIEHSNLAIRRLASLGYRHLGDLGISGREAIGEPEGLPRHNLYVCLHNSIPLKNHLMLRDYLRTHPEAVEAYGILKKRLAADCDGDIDAYVRGKTDFIVSILEITGCPAEMLETIRRQNAGEKSEK